MLDEIQDPHNFGAIIRNAFGFEIDAIITTHHRSCPIGLGVLRSSAGYSEEINIVESKNFAKTIEILKENDFWIVTLDSHENFSGSIEDLIKKYKKCAFIFGSEGPGVREQNKKLSDIRLRIKTNSKVESLNVSSISAIIGYEFFKFGKS
jgi:23S rRNA (guanosine2251-2'-O)-methyltransferase